MKRATELAKRIEKVYPENGRSPFTILDRLLSRITKEADAYKLTFVKI